MHPEPVTQVPPPEVGGVGRRVGQKPQPQSTGRSGRRRVIDLGETEQRRLRLLAERVGDLPALGGRQHEAAIARAAGIQAEHPPRRAGHVTQVDVEAARQLLDGLPAVDGAGPVGAVVHVGMVPRMTFRPTPGARAGGRGDPRGCAVGALTRPEPAMTAAETRTADVPAGSGLHPPAEPAAVGLNVSRATDPSVPPALS